MNTEHTPGQWFADGHRVTYAHGHIASFWGPREISDERLDGESWLDMRNRTQPERAKLDREVKANARLAAAAPDLLLALSGLLATSRQAITSGDWKVDGACDPEIDFLRADATIAKALGEQQ